MFARRTLLTALACLFLALVSFGASTPAEAASLDELRADGVIAERWDGYVEVRVGTPPAEAQQVVERINAERRQVYEKRAQQQGVTPESVGKVYAPKILEKAPVGTYFKKSDGSYVRK
ncbi:YdbL family protein [Rhodovibrio salinarum]|nr:YdbL family protein [Rhodovibrio salinarum]